MEATDLQIGDWIAHVDAPVKVSSIVATEDGYMVQAVGKGLLVADYLSNFNPIPLTEDILVKNGFESDGMYARLKLDEHNTLEYYFHGKELRMWWQGIDEWQNNTEQKEISFLCQCYYVHELQHALKLCRLNYLTEEFKIE